MDPKLQSPATKTLPCGPASQLGLHQLFPSHLLSREAAGPFGASTRRPHGALIQTRGFAP